MGLQYVILKQCQNCFGKVYQWEYRPISKDLCTCDARDLRLVCKEDPRLSEREDLQIWYWGSSDAGATIKKDQLREDAIIAPTTRHLIEYSKQAESIYQMLRDREHIRRPLRRLQKLFNEYVPPPAEEIGPPDDF